MDTCISTYVHVHTLTHIHTHTCTHTCTRRAQEADLQSRDLVAIATKKEEMVQKLQHRIDEQCEEISALRLQLESSKGEAKQLCEQQKDKAAAKVCI